MGENGAGKSTLIKILAGAVSPDHGDIAIDGHRVEMASPEEAHARGLRFIHQELNIVPALSVAENLFLGRDYPRRFGALVNSRQLHEQARRALADLDLAQIDPATPMARLSTGDRMLVKIAAAFLSRDYEDARVFVMDEPTAALTGAESERLFRIIAALKDKGCGVLYVSHRMDEVMRLSDRIVVLRDGRTVATLDTRQTSRAEVIEWMTGRTMSEGHPERMHPPGDDVALRVTGLADGPLKDVSFDLRKGEILGLAGLAGSGQGRLLKALMGHAGPGVIELDGRPRRIRSPAQAWKAGIAYVPRERRAEGLVLSHDVTANATLPHLRNLSRFRLLLDRKQLAGATARMTERVRLKAKNLRQKVWQLSGGNQQKVVFARALMGKPRLLLLDEPTRGVDVGAKYDIHAMLRELAEQGSSILMASSDLPELIGMSDRIAVLREGRIGAIVPAQGLSQQQLLALCYGEPKENASHAHGA